LAAPAAAALALTDADVAALQAGLEVRRGVCPLGSLQTDARVPTPLWPER
jgi:hypothetical protein